MIIPGRDRCCQKVTRRRGNGLLQPCSFFSFWVGEQTGDGEGTIRIKEEVTLLQFHH